MVQPVGTVARGVLLDAGQITDGTELYGQVRAVGPWYRPLLLINYGLYRVVLAGGGL